MEDLQMDISKAHVETILKTLPIGYYIGRNIKVSLSESEECSFYDQINDEILISYQQLLKPFEAVEKVEDVETFVRTMLYHEVSHAMLTPKMKMTSILNIFEDERIETLLKDYYQNTDFKRFVKLVNNFKGEAPTTPMQAFYQIVRYRIGPQNFVDRVCMIIIKAKQINRTNEERSSIVRSYKDEIYQLYNDIVDWFAKQSLDNEQNQEKKEQNNVQTSTSSDQSSEAEKLDDSATSTKTSAVSSMFDEATHMTGQEVKDTFKSISTVYYDKAFDDQIKLILRQLSTANAKNASAISAYSGAFDPRLVARDDYKYFARKNRLGNVKAYSKFRLNLFIDTSGSFTTSQKIVNCMLHSLANFEKQNPDFEFNLVTCNIGQQIRSKSHKEIECHGRNDLKDTIFEQFKSLQSKEKQVYNIVLFDGDAYSEAKMNYNFQSSQRKEFMAFDTANTTIISDNDNKYLIERYCHRAKKIFTNRYADELMKNILNTLRILAH